MTVLLIRRVMGLLLICAAIGIIALVASARTYATIQNPPVTTNTLFDFTAVIAFVLWWLILVFNGFTLLLGGKPDWQDCAFGVVSYLAFILSLIGNIPNIEVRFDALHLTALLVFWVAPAIQFMYLCLSAVDAVPDSQYPHTG